MNCPQCGTWTDVKETRNRTEYMYRRRECANGHFFTTEERVRPERVLKLTKEKVNREK
jgi:hypothetical protein